MSEALQPPYEYIAESMKSGRVIPFLGSGASLDLQRTSSEWLGPNSESLPNSSTLASYLERLSGYPPSEAVELPRVAQYFDGVTGRGGLEDKLHEIFARVYPPQSLHHYLAEFPRNLLIVTTNYDNLIECAFNERNRPFDLLIYNTNSVKLSYLRHDRSEPEEVIANEFDLNFGDVTVIFKMHGSADSHFPEHDSYVITESDYIEFLSRMATAVAIPASIVELFRKSHFLFLGYGLKDWNLRVILHKIWKDWPRRYASWAIQHEPSRLEQKFWERRELAIYNLSIQEFLQELTKR